MAKRDLFSKYKQWDKDFDSDDYLKHSALSEVEEAKPKKSKSKGATSKSKTTPKKPKISDQAVQKSSTEDDSDLEDLYKDHVLKFNDVSLPEITPPRKTRGRPRKSGQNVSPLPKKSKKNTTNTQSIAVVADSKPTRPTTPENIEMVDLCGPPTPPSLAPIFQKNDVNVIADDGEDLDDSYDFDLYRIKVKWQGKVEIHPMRKHEKFQCLMEKLAARENVEASSIFLNEGDKIIGRDETPDSIDYKISMFISARALNISAFDTIKQKPKQNTIELKVQSAKWKKPKVFKVIKTDNFEVLFEKIAEECGSSVSSLKLSFDGDAIQRTDKPSDHDMEGGEVIDCNI